MKLTQKEQQTYNKFSGTLIGLAVGDALGAAVEFKPRGSFQQVTDMRGGGPHNLEPGYWTDDTSMALCLAESLIESGFDLKDQLDKYLKWYRDGYLSSTGSCFDIGINTSNALANYEQTGELPPEKERAAGNGSLMRLAPIPMYYHNSFQKAVKYSGESSLSTHNNIMAIDACRFTGGLIQTFISSDYNSNASKEDSIRSTADQLSLDGRVKEAITGALTKESDQQIKSDGFVINSLEASLWSFVNTSTFKAAVLKAVNLGHDADTTGAITGQIAGAFYGRDGIPESWILQLADEAKIYEIIDDLFSIRF
ncbi:ADP-ribosylglycohydrolase family protein [Halanaerobiaceae bacterium Z-7014]|uniref:ADP-ribosylglycohydrolase family protein n=1 Tax=Halonatronomonas betaini TaxID=2778430 RepID=A0A931ASQ5_9FIRM|nr:ADP-ribosylglycohydrolase family protein [Halonatronomonas betaini]MBF8435511.1 ADP-ribosylglycohydrolase family protein [Halonatronomonas betaini]